MFQQTFKNIDDILHKDAGCGSELDYVEQTSWILFLKYLDDLEKDKQTAAELMGVSYNNIIASEYRWVVWAVPKNTDDKLDHHKALTGDDLKDFVDHQLFPYLKKFKVSADNANTIEYKIGEIFSELKNKIQSGYNLREIINFVLGNYIERGIEELDQQKLSFQLTSKYHSLEEAKGILGEVSQIRELFIGFQQYLYPPNVA